MNTRVQHHVAGRLSLRPPQAESLSKLIAAITAAPELLAHDADGQTRDVAAILNSLKAEFKTLEDFAQIAGMSASHFSAVFRQKLQSTPVHFFTFLKMQRACYLLEFTTLRVKEVAFQMGYHDPYHFSRVFTNIMGKSPRDFRNDKVQGVDYL